MVTGADTLLDELAVLGVDYIFANLGTDYPAVLEARARRHSLHLSCPEFILCQHETVAVSAAMGYAQLTGRTQAVFVHVDVGTAASGSAIHNSNRGRIGILVFAGLSPWTTRGESAGSRSNAVQYWQDIPDQPSLVRPYMKWIYEIRSPANIRQVLRRGHGIASTDPQGPVYLTAAREPLAADCPDSLADVSAQPSHAKSVPEPAFLSRLAEWIDDSVRPVIVTSYLGRNQAAVAPLVELAELCSIPVAEVAADYMNFPITHPLHAGLDAEEVIRDADLVIVIDCDVPWLPARHSLTKNARVVHMDVDVLKLGINLADIPAAATAQVDAAATLSTLVALMSEKLAQGESARIRSGSRIVSSGRETVVSDPLSVAPAGDEDVVSPDFLSGVLGTVLDRGAILLDETVTNRRSCRFLTGRDQAGTYFGPGGSALGWGLGAALGAKLASPDHDIVLAVGDGAFVFGNPSAAFWGARRYSLPFLCVIYNNRAWDAVRSATREQYPHGHAVRNDDFVASLNPAIDLPAVAAAAGDVWTTTVYKPPQLESALAEGLRKVREGIPAVVDVMISMSPS